MNRKASYGAVKRKKEVKAYGLWRKIPQNREENYKTSRNEGETYSEVGKAEKEKERRRREWGRRTEKMNKGNTVV